MLRCKLSKHNDDFNVKVSNIWKRSTAKETRSTRLRRTWVFYLQVSFRGLPAGWLHN